MSLVVAIEDPGAPDVVALLERHLAFSHEVTPAGGVFALDLDALRRPEITFLSGREDGHLVGIAALQELNADHGEVKSMHTAAAARGRGVGRALLLHVLDLARARGYRRVSLETGNFAAYAPARALYESVGFVDCPRYGPYLDSPTSACMTIALGDRPA